MSENMGMNESLFHLYVLTFLAKLQHLPFLKLTLT